jgi:hypothetical protein
MEAEAVRFENGTANENVSQRGQEIRRQIGNYIF